MKDSGIEWIGEIPEGWEVSLLKYATRWKSEKGCPDAPVLSLYRDFGVVPKDSRDDNHNVTSLDTSNYKVVDIGDLVINKMKAWQGSMAVSDYRGIVSPAYHVCSITSNKVNKRYLHHLLRNPAYLPEYARLSTGMRIGQWDLGFDDFKNIPFLIPPLDEQEKIADYLDNGCASLDAILDKTRASIEEYKKLKQAVITQAVTKGVRGEREMKDSGVEWIGAIPKDWEIKRLKSFCTIVDCKNRTPDVFSDGKYTVVRTTCIKDCSFSYEGSYQTDTTNFKAWTLKGQPHKGDIFFTREAPVGEACLVPNADNLCMGQRVMFFRPEDNSDARYIMYSIYGPLVREYIASKNSGSTVGHLKLGQVACIPIFYCPPLEQKEIADYLDAKCAEIDGLIAKKEQLVKELESYKKSLIYEVVTGKREV